MLAVSFFKYKPMEIFLVELTGENYLRFITDPFYRGVMGYTAWLAFLVTFFSLVLGYPLSYFLARTRSPRKGVYLFLLLVPLMVGIIVRTYAGADIDRRFLPRMYAFYRRTNDKFGPWGCRYLTDRFFDDLYDRYRHRLVIMAAFEGKDRTEPVGMSLLIKKRDQLFGRYWGSLKQIQYLHFEVCYYAPIQWAIANGIRRFDPGLGGPHKLRRGFAAVPTFSLHRFYDQRMQHLLHAHIDEINRLERENIDHLNRHLPFAKKPEKDPSQAYR